jgi:hypothetical protein
VLNLVSRHEWIRLIQLDSKGPIIQRNDFELERKVILPMKDWELYRRLSLNPLIQVYNVLRGTWLHGSLTPGIKSESQNLCFVVYNLGPGAGAV